MGTTRTTALASLAEHTTFDLAIIGAGATGCGLALDAAARGFSVETSIVIWLRHRRSL